MKLTYDGHADHEKMSANSSQRAILLPRRTEI